MENPGIGGDGALAALLLLLPVMLLLLLHRHLLLLLLLLEMVCGGISGWQGTLQTGSVEQTGVAVVLAARLLVK